MTVIDHCHYTVERQTTKEKEMTEREGTVASRGRSTRRARPTSPNAVDVARIYILHLYLDEKPYFCVELNHPFFRGVQNAIEDGNGDGIYAQLLRDMHSYSLVSNYQREMSCHTSFGDRCRRKYVSTIHVNLNAMCIQLYIGCYRL